MYAPWRMMTSGYGPRPSVGALMTPQLLVGLVEVPTVSDCARPSKKVVRIAVQSCRCAARRCRKGRVGSRTPGGDRSALHEGENGESDPHKEPGVNWPRPAVARPPGPNTSHPFLRHPFSLADVEQQTFKQQDYGPRRRPAYRRGFDDFLR